MPDKDLSNYFYGDEATQFTYFRIPCQLITHPRFKHLSTDSKLLYPIPQQAKEEETQKKSEVPRSTREILARAREWLESVSDDCGGC